MAGTKAVFTCAAVYQVEAVCKTPLRIGSSERDGELVLRSWDGTALIPGTSLAGAFRTWLESSASGKSGASALFGTQKQEGHLIVSDGVFDANARQMTRPRLRINGQMGTADDGGKFDIAHMETGSVFQFALTWLGDKDKLPELDWVEQILAALHEGDILLGAQKTNGFGQVSLSVKKRVYYMENESDRTAWLEEKGDAQPFALPEVVRRRQVVFHVAGKMDQVLVKASAQEQRGKESVTVNLTECGRGVIPGSSVKGALRARVTAILPLMGLPEEQADVLFGRGAEQEDNGIAGTVRCSDVLLEEKKQTVRRIRINRFTGGVMRGGLFTEEPYAGDVQLRITAPEDGISCLLVLTALRDLGLGLYPLGSNGAIGRGYLSGACITAEHPDGRTLKLRFDQANRCALEDPSGLYQEWSKEWEGMKS